MMGCDFLASLIVWGLVSYFGGNMPVQSCQSDGKPGFQWGQQGKCYTYEPGNEESRQRAHDKAMAQGHAIENQERGDHERMA